MDLGNYLVGSRFACAQVALVAQILQLVERLRVIVG